MKQINILQLTTQFFVQNLLSAKAVSLPFLQNFSLSCNPNRIMTHNKKKGHNCHFKQIKCSGDQKECLYRLTDNIAKVNIGKLKCTVKQGEKYQRE